MVKTTTAALLLFVFSALAPKTIAQTSATSPETPAFRSRSSAVLVPTMVVDKYGETVHGLHAEDFIILDNGIEQSLRLDEEPVSQPMSVVVLVQTGRSAGLHLRANRCHNKAIGKVIGEMQEECYSELSGLSTMLEVFLPAQESRVAVLSFDSHTHPVQDFSPYNPALAEELGRMREGDNGAAIRDAVGRGIKLLEQRPPNQRRILILISEERDQGSASSTKEIVQKITESNTIIYAMAFSPMRAELHDKFIKSLHNEDSMIAFDPMHLYHTILSAMKKNAALEISGLTGGEYASFKDRESFEDAMATFANHLHNRYLLSFQPVKPQPGLHTLEVRLRQPKQGVLVQARSSYWSSVEE